MADLVDMPITLPPSKLQSVEVQLGLGIAHNDIARRCRVSQRSISRIRHNLGRYGTPKRPRAENQGRPWRMTAEMEEVHDICMIYFNAN